MTEINKINSQLADLDAEIRATNLNLAAAMDAGDKPRIRQLRGYRYNLEDDRNDLTGAMQTARFMAGGAA